MTSVLAAKSIVPPASDVGPTGAAGGSVVASAVNATPLLNTASALAANHRRFVDIIDPPPCLEVVCRPLRRLTNIAFIPPAGSGGRIGAGVVSVAALGGGAGHMLQRILSDAAAGVRRQGRAW